MAYMDVRTPSGRGWCNLTPVSGEEFEGAPSSHFFLFFLFCFCDNGSLYGFGSLCWWIFRGSRISICTFFFPMGRGRMLLNNVVADLFLSPPASALCCSAACFEQRWCGTCSAKFTRRTTPPTCAGKHIFSFFHTSIPPPPPRPPPRPPPFEKKYPEIKYPRVIDAWIIREMI